MAEYCFVTTWRIGKPIGPVWDAILDVERYPEWWPGVKRVERLGELGPGVVGARHAQTWRSVLPYDVRFTMRQVRVEPPVLTEYHAEGDLDGLGRWRLKEEGSETVVYYDWIVRTTKLWQNLMTPIARPVLAWNHDVVMGWGGRGLATYLGAPLISAKSQLVPAGAPLEGA
jgi:hypothetical protein